MTTPRDTEIHTAKRAARQAAFEGRATAWAAWRARGPEAAAQSLAGLVGPVVTHFERTCPPGTPPASRVASAYLPMRTEIDPLGLLAALAGRGFGPALPVVPGRGVPLVFRAWPIGGPTVVAGFGTREPPPANAAVAPDLLMVPLLAFDARGFRLGYGGGYYDRTLRTLRAHKPICAIGIAFDEQEVDAVPRLDYDEPLDAVVTPSGLRHMNGRFIG